MATSSGVVNKKKWGADLQNSADEWVKGCSVALAIIFRIFVVPLFYVLRNTDTQR